MDIWPDRQSSSSAATSPPLRGLRANPAAASRLGTLVVAVGLLLALLEGYARDNHNLLAVGLAAAALGRGIALRRPVRLPHVAAAVVFLAIAAVAAHRSDRLVEQAAIVLAGVAALWAPAPPAPGSTSERRHIASLVDITADDCVAPFAMRRDKSYVFSPDGRAAVAYRVRFGIAVASGDPIGATESQPGAVEAFRAMAEGNGWRIGLLGTGEVWTEWWRQHGYRSLAIGRDVVIDVGSFDLVGRRFRNLRQAVQRTRNAGVTTAVYPADDLPDGLAEKLRAIVAASRRNPERGFSMILDGLLDEPPHPGTLLAVAYDRDGEVAAFHRFSTADAGREITQDLPWRRPGAPNGVDERLAYDVVEWGRERGAKRVSLSFAAFPELYAHAPQTRVERISYWLTHRLDSAIRLESLYRYLRKFNSLGGRRYVALRLRDLLPVALAMLTFEFATRPSLRRSNRWRSEPGALNRST